MQSSARDWALWMTEQPTVTGTPGERSFPEALLKRIARSEALRSARTWLIRAPDDPLGRSCAAVLVRGEGRETVLLTGHFDTVAIDDYGPLAHLATKPEALTHAMISALSEPRTPAEKLALADLTSGDFLPGRGLLDMKAGLAAGLAALEAFASTPSRRGNLLFVAVPDEEVNSNGARALAAALPGIEAENGIRVCAAINLDAIADNGNGSTGRAIALGSVGKLLLTALAIGQPSHACYPFNGMNAAVLAASIAAAVEWNPALADTAPGHAGMPPTLLCLKDGKAQYDVTTPASTFAAWNALTLGRTAESVFASFESIVRTAVASATSALAVRREAVLGAGIEAAPVVEVHDAQRVVGLAQATNAGAAAVREAAEQAAASGANLPEQCRRITEAAFAASGLAGPCVIIGFGSLPYPAVSLSASAAAERLKDAAVRAAARAQARGAGSIAVSPFFQGISDMSFLGEADASAFAIVADNTPAWTTGVRWSGAVAGVPTINIGPWGRDYHTPLERLHAPYAFEHLPMLILDTCRTLLSPGDVS
jgi:arginine utilization protein RocB